MIGLGCRDRADLQAADVFLNQLVADIEALRDTLRDVACGNLSAGRAGNLRKDKTGIDRVNAHRYRLSHVLGAAVAERPHSKAEAFGRDPH